MTAKSKLSNIWRKNLVLIRRSGFYHVPTGRTYKSLMDIPRPWVAIPDSDRDSDITGSPIARDVFGDGWSDYFSINEVAHGAREYIRQ